MNRNFQDRGGRDRHDVIDVAPGGSSPESNRRFRQRLSWTHRMSAATITSRSSSTSPGTSCSVRPGSGSMTGQAPGV